MRHDRFFARRPFARHGGKFAVAAAIFAVGFAAGATVSPSLTLPGAVPPVTPAIAAAGEVAPPGSGKNAQRPEPRLGYPAEVVRIIDGDTFEARVRVWPGLDVDTKVRLRDIDAPELHARCAEEHVKADAARAALETILAEGEVAISRVGIDKYGGRVDAAVSTRNTADVSAALLNGGWARSYDGRRRGTWC